MQIDIILNEFTSPSENAELSALVESYGCRAVWSPSYASGRNPFLSLALAAGSTKKVRLGPLAISPMEMPPIVMSNALLTLNELCNGRSMIAVGGGGGVLGAMGLKSTRIVKSVRECVEILKGATSEKMLNYKGDIYQTIAYRPRDWATDTPPQIYVCASHPRMTHMATEMADGLMGSDLIPSMVRETKEIVEQGLSDNGRSGQPFGISNFWAWHIKKDKQEAMREARRELILRGMLWPRYTEACLSKEDSDFVQDNMGEFWKAFRQGTGKIEGVPETILNTLIDKLSSTGDINDLDREIERMKEFKAVGLTEIALRVHDDPVEGIKLIGEHIVPAVQ